MAKLPLQTVTLVLILDRSGSSVDWEKPIRTRKFCPLITNNLISETIPRYELIFPKGHAFPSYIKKKLPVIKIYQN